MGWGATHDHDEARQAEGDGRDKVGEQRDREDKCAHGVGRARAEAPGALEATGTAHGLRGGLRGRWPKARADGAAAVALAAPRAAAAAQDFKVRTSPGRGAAAPAPFFGKRKRVARDGANHRRRGGHGK